MNGASLVQLATATAGASLRSEAGAATVGSAGAAVQLRLSAAVVPARLVPLREGGDEYVVSPGAKYALHLRLERSSEGTSGAFPSTPRMVVSTLASDVTISVPSYDSEMVEGETAKLDLAIAEDAGPSPKVLELRISFDSAPARTVASIRLCTLKEAEPPATLFEAEVFNLDKRAERQGIAFLHTTREANGLFAMGFHEQAGPLGRHAINEPKSHVLDAVLADGKSQDTYKIISDMGAVSRKYLPKVRAWLEKVMRYDGALIVSESTDSSIPWEMLEIDDDQNPVGAKIKVVRWTRVAKGASVALADTSRHTHEGGLLSFGDYDELRKGASEKRELDPWGNHNDSIRNMDQLLEKLPSDVALVFLAAHGFNRAADGSGRIEQKGGVVLQASDFEPRKNLKPPRPFAFFNACYSARLGKSAELVEGLPEVFLAKFAASFLGCLGAVDEGVAASVGAQLLRLARDEETGVDIPALLLKLRATAAKNRDAGDPNWRTDFVNTFMYVFYGSPDTWLKLKLPVGKGAANGS